ncbi:hypothetical protein AAMO2058_001642900 [Amorphochlora amoebiformis]
MKKHKRKGKPDLDTNGLDMLQFTALHSEHIVPKENLGPLKDSGDGAGLRYRLKIQPQPPPYPFVQKFIDIQLYLVDSNDTMKVGSRLPIEITLHYQDGDKVPDQSILETMGPDLAISTQGMAVVKFRICEVSMKHENRKFCLKFACSTVDPMHQMVMPVVSQPMTVILHKLKIRPTPAFPKVWYKDEGGRDKFIPLNAVLEDQNMNIVPDREVPIRVVLTYEGDVDSEVKNQSILKLSNDSLAKIGRNGRVTLRVRIEEVSKNHQKQAFCVKIVPDTSYSPTFFDIAMDVSPPITVKSKRNKRNLRGSGRGNDKKARIDPTNHLASSSLLGMAGPVNSLLSADQISKLQNNSDFGVALQMTRSWCQHVVQSLQAMEWQHVGFEVVEGGQLNLHRPLYRCPGCWAYKDTLRVPRHQPDCSLSVALNFYKRHVDQSLKSLFSTLNGTVKSGTTKPKQMSTSSLPAPNLTSEADKKKILKTSLPSPLVPPKAPIGPLTPSARSSLSPPTFAPSISIPKNLAPVPTTRAFSLGFLKDPTDSAFLRQDEDEESNVAQILVAQTTHGFPAFDAQDKLIGFYVYDDQSTTITFFRLKNYKEISAERKKELEDALQSHKRDKKSSVITKAQEITLQKMKDQVMMSIFEIMDNINSYFPQR